jgi:hypothetical protein
MKWRSLTPPKITRINGGDGGDNVPGQGTGYQCMQPSGICQTGGQLGTQGTFGDIGSCQTNCNATGFGPIGGGGGGLYTGDNMVGGQKKKVFRRRMGQ